MAYKDKSWHHDWEHGEAYGPYDPQVGDVWEAIGTFPCAECGELAIEDHYLCPTCADRV